MRCCFGQIIAFDIRPHEQPELPLCQEHSADAAHQINDKGQNPTAALELVMMFANELLALCPWLTLVGQSWQSNFLRDEVHKVISMSNRH